MIRTYACIAPRPRALLAAAAAGLLITAALPAAAQQTQVQMSGLKQDRNAPVDVTSDQLSVDQNAGLAVFTGNVVVIQGTMRMTAPKVDVTYGKTPTGETGNVIEQIHATGGVTLITPTEAAEGGEAVYHPETGDMVMTKDVLLTQGPNSITGQKLTMDLDTGTGLMSGGRVRTVFQNQPKAPEGGN